MGNSSSKNDKKLAFKRDSIDMGAAEQMREFQLKMQQKADQEAQAAKKDGDTATAGGASSSTATTNVGDSGGKNS